MGSPGVRSMVSVSRHGLKSKHLKAKTKTKIAARWCSLPRPIPGGTSGRWRPLLHPGPSSPARSAGHSDAPNETPQGQRPPAAPRHRNTFSSASSLSGYPDTASITWDWWGTQQSQGWGWQGFPRKHFPGSKASGSLWCRRKLRLLWGKRPWRLGETSAPPAGCGVRAMAA